MKKYVAWTVLLLSSIAAAAETKTIEIPVTRVFIPAVGFDDNDNVQFVVSGELPDPCYVLGETFTQRTAEHKILVRQTAWRRTEGACGTGQPVGEGSYFMTEVNLGRMREGGYEILYQKDRNAIRTASRRFEVAKSGVPTADRLNYAPISNVVAEDVVWENDDVVISLTGIFPNNCSEMDEPTEIISLDDVRVVLPVMKKNGVPCVPGLFPFKEKLRLGKFRAGIHLIHVRSRSGAAVNRILRVVPRAQR